MEKITYNQYLHTFFLWKKDQKNQRFGQFFMNNVYPKVADAEIFFEKNVSRASELILEKYVSDAPLKPEGPMVA